MLKKTPKISIHQLVYKRFNLKSLNEAKALVMSGKVICGDQRIDKPGQLVKADSNLRIKGQKQFVSRAGSKLLGALQKSQLGINLSGKITLDVGASTGGFTDCLLQLGASNCYCIDVGTNQLAWSLRDHSQVTCFENTNFKSFDHNLIQESLDLVVADLSFTSLNYFSQDFAKLKTSQKKISYLLLIKPQFEIAREYIPKGGVVKDPFLWEKAINNVKKEYLEKGFELLEIIPSPLPGKQGNMEFFLHLEK